MNPLISPLYSQVLGTDYTRNNALEEQVLVDISRIAHNRDYFDLPVAVSRTVYQTCMAWNAEDTGNQTYQTETNRIQDILAFAKYAARHADSGQSEAEFSISIVPRDGLTRHSVIKRLKIIISQGDQSEPVLTIVMCDDPDKKLFAYLFSQHDNEELSGSVS